MDNHKNKEKIDNFFIDIQKRLCQWLDKRPTGEFSVRFNANEGGIRGRPDVTIKEKI